MSKTRDYESGRSGSKSRRCANPKIELARDQLKELAEFEDDVQRRLSQKPYGLVP